MLAHSKNEILSALTKVKSTMEQVAIQSFKDLLGWMTDRPVSDCQRQGLAEAIVNRAKLANADKEINTSGGCIGMSNEIFAQVLKQLTRNPSMRSRLCGWRLLLQLVQQVQ